MTSKPMQKGSTFTSRQLVRALKEMNQKLDHIIYRLSEMDPRTKRVNRYGWERYLALRDLCEGEGPDGTSDNRDSPI